MNQEALDYKVKTLRQLILLSWLDEDKIDLLADKAQATDLKPGDTCLAKGSDTKGIHIITKGAIEVFKGESTSPHDIVCTLIKGDFFGQNCLLGQGKSEGTFIALENSSLIFISLEALHDFEKKHPDQYALIISNLARFYSRTLRQINERLIPAATKK